MKKFLLVSLLTLIPVMQGCEGLKDLNLATQDCLKNPEDLGGPDVLVIPDTEIPPEILESDKFKDKKFIVAPKELLKPECTTSVPFDPNSEGWLDALVAAIISIATVFFPKLAALEAILIFLSRRKRMHYANAAKAIVPYDGNVDVKEALSSISKALGIQHSSTESKDAFEQKEPPTTPPPQA